MRIAASSAIKSQHPTPSKDLPDLAPVDIQLSAADAWKLIKHSHTSCSSYFVFSLSQWISAKSLACNQHNADSPTMPEKPLTIATYAAGASLAAITLVYVFGPTFFIDGEAAGAPSSSRKRYAVGLINTANDCFINSALQALAGLGDLRLYLIRETHRRRLDGAEVYAQIVQDATVKGMSGAKIGGLQGGIVTRGMKEMLDALNERPLSKKNISPQPFIAAMEAGYKTRISRQQQDAHEFLVLVAERMCDEYHAGHRARKHARQTQGNSAGAQTLDEGKVDRKLNELVNGSGTPTSPAPEFEASTEPSDKEVISGDTSEKNSTTYDEEDGFPLEGAWESQIECQSCGFKPKATESTFAILTLSVPQVSSTSLNSCFDDVFKTEIIDDFKCEKCRLVHALDLYKQESRRSTSDQIKAQTEASMEKIQSALETDPEAELLDVELPDTKLAPKRRIKKHNRITRFPKILAIHLSRSIFDGSSATMKNSAKISFEERLTLGGLLNRRVYKLSSVICHKGSHGSGHYESFRRQSVMTPFSTPNAFGTSGVYSKQPTPLPSQISTPQIRALQKDDDTNVETNTLSSTPELLSPASASSSSVSFNNIDALRQGEAPTSAAASMSSQVTAKGKLASAAKDSDTSSVRSFARSARSKLSKNNDSATTPSSPARQRGGMSDIIKGKRKTNNKWWRISDSKVKECKTSDLLGMQKEVYMLFYELEKDEDSPA